MRTYNPTPAASTINKSFIMNDLSDLAKISGQNCTVTVQSPPKFCSTSANRAQSEPKSGVPMLTVYTRHHLA
jgi:hypothetical protein